MNLLTRSHGDFFRTTYAICTSNAYSLSCHGL